MNKFKVRLQKKMIPIQINANQYYFLIKLVLADAENYFCKVLHYEV